MRILIMLLLLIPAHTGLLGQSIYFYTDGPPYPPGYWKLDVNTCDICPAFSPDFSLDPPGNFTNDGPYGAVLLPNGDLINLRAVGTPGNPPGGFARYDPPNPTRIYEEFGFPPYTGGCVSTSGTVYFTSEGSLYTFNPATDEENAWYLFYLNVSLNHSFLLRSKSRSLLNRPVTYMVSPNNSRTWHHSVPCKALWAYTGRRTSCAVHPTDLRAPKLMKWPDKQLRRHSTRC